MSQPKQDQIEKTNKKIENELQSIKKLLVLIAIKLDATSEEIDKATNMGAGNVRRLFPQKRKQKVNADVS